MSLLLALAYVAVAALLLNLNVTSAWSAPVKAAAIAVVSLLYGGTYLGIRTLEGWRPITLCYFIYGFGYLLILAFLTARLQDDSAINPSAFAARSSLSMRGL